MPRTKKPKISSDEQTWLNAIDSLPSMNLQRSRRMDWDKRSELSDMFSKIKEHCQKGGDFSIGWDDFFDRMFPEIPLVGMHDFLESKCNICYAYARKQGRLKLNQEIKFLGSASNNWRSASNVYKYARYVVRGRLHTDVEAVVDFSRCYKYPEWLNKQHLPYEDILIKNTTAAFHFYCSNFYLPDNVHNMMIASKLGGDKCAAAYFKEKEKVETYLLTALSNVEKTMTVGDFIKKIMK